jgi:hypothetical protein
MKVGTMSPFLVPLGETADVANSQSLEGRTYFNKAAAHTFLGFLRAGLPLAQKPTVRRPTQLEIAVLWSMIPFDLKDPLFVVEIGGHNLIVVLSPEERTVLWIDDLAGVSFEPGKGVILPSAPRYIARS